MNAVEVLKLVDLIHREKNIDKEIVFEGIEGALITAAKRQFGETEAIEVQINRQSGAISGTHNGVPLDPDMIGRIGAQTAKQVMIQKIREAERDAVYDKFTHQRGQLVTGTVVRFEGGKTIVSLPPYEAILPRSEQIPGESYHANDRVRATISDVEKRGGRVQIVLSRTRGDLVRRLFEQEIPEIADGVIEIKAVAREVGYRAKVAVHSVDQRVDCVGACVGVRGNRIKNIVDELHGERIDIVRWSDARQILITNALQPAEVDEVILCEKLERAIVLVGSDQLSLAIGKRGQNVRLAKKLCGWDIEIMTRDELSDQIDRALVAFGEIPNMADSLKEQLVGEGFLSFEDLTVMEPVDLQEMGGLTEEEVDEMLAVAEDLARQAEALADEEKRRFREQQRQQAQMAEYAPQEGGNGGGGALSLEEALQIPTETPHTEGAAAEEAAVEAEAAAPPAESDDENEIAAELVEEGAEAAAEDTAAEAEAEIAAEEAAPAKPEAEAGA